MSNEARERFLENLRARGLLADEEVRTARRLPAEAPAALVHQVAPLAARERRRGSRVAAMVPGKGVRPGREGRGPSAGEAPAVKRKPMPAPVVGLLALVGVAAVAGLFLLVLYAGGFLGGEPPPETRSGAGAQAPGSSRTEPIPEGSERMSRAERNAQAALASARRLENTPDTPHNEVLLAYRNVITFYPGTRAAREAEEAVGRLKAVEAVKEFLPPEPPPKEPTPPPEPPPPPQPPPREPPKKKPKKTPTKRRRKKSSADEAPGLTPFAPPAATAAAV